MEIAFRVLKKVFEPRSPGLRRRLQTVETLSKAGILVSTGLMPIIPFIGYSKKHMEDVVRAIKDHGGSSIMAGGHRQSL